jgi:hypothetical protein
MSPRVSSSRSCSGKRLDLNSTRSQTVTFRIRDPRCGSRTLLAGDRDGGRREAQVAGLIGGADLNGIATAILIIAVRVEDKAAVHFQTNPRIV